LSIPVFDVSATTISTTPTTLTALALRSLDSFDASQHSRFLQHTAYSRHLPDLGVLADADFANVEPVVTLNSAV